MVAAQEIIAAMQAAAPAGRSRPDCREIIQLQSLTADLIAAKPEALSEADRFQVTSLRSMPLAGTSHADALAGRSILVTGGTGCIGSVLLPLLERAKPCRLVSVSRGVTNGWSRLQQAEYRHADIADAAAMANIFADTKPDLVFHLAGQRDPGRAECAVVETVRTNVVGTRTVIELAASFGVTDVVCATSGKALRPYSQSVYTATKRVAEWLLARAASQGTSRYSAVRFTHVVNNSIVHRRFRRCATTADGVLRLHDPDIIFYAQSALESAQLMIYASVRAQSGTSRSYAINDLGWPVSLLDLAIGTLLQLGSDRPIYFSGHDPGYEAAPFPGLYDPVTAGGVSALLNGFEALHVEQDIEGGVDASPVVVNLAQVPENLLTRLERACTGPDAEPKPVRAALDELTWHVFNATLAAVPKAALHRVASQTRSQSGDLSCEHARMLDAIRRHADAAALATV